MSLELAIQENTAALRDLIARLTAGSPTAVTMSATEYVEKLDKPAVEDTKAKEESKPADTKAKTEPVALDYNKEVKPLLLKVSASKGRDALVELLNKFGVTKGDQLPAEKLADVVAEVNDLLAA